MLRKKSEGAFYPLNYHVCLTNWGSKVGLGGVGAETMNPFNFNYCFWTKTNINGVERKLCKNLTPANIGHQSTDAFWLWANGTWSPNCRFILRV